MTAVPELGCGALIGERNDAGPGAAAVLHARYHLLAIRAALGKIDPMKLVHVGFVGERVAICEIETAARYAKHDPMRLIVLRRHQGRVEIGGRLRGEIRRQHHAPSERR